jgi:hypothetical protein
MFARDLGVHPECLLPRQLALLSILESDRKEARMRRLLLALAATAPLLALDVTPAAAWGWDRGYGYSGSFFNYCPPYRSYYYSYRPSYGYRPYYGAYWRPRFYTSSYFYRPYRPWGFRSWGYRPWGYRSWGYRPVGFRSWGYRPWGFRSWGHRGWGHRSWGFRSWGHRGWGHRGWGGRRW